MNLEESNGFLLFHKIDEIGYVRLLYLYRNSKKRELVVLGKVVGSCYNKIIKSEV